MNVPAPGIYVGLDVDDRKQHKYVGCEYQIGELDQSCLLLTSKIALYVVYEVDEETGPVDEVVVEVESLHAGCGGGYFLSWQLSIICP